MSNIINIKPEEVVQDNLNLYLTSYGVCVEYFWVVYSVTLGCEIIKENPAEILFVWGFSLDGSVLDPVLGFRSLQIRQDFFLWVLIILAPIL
jgi:hypothetical protein